MSGRLPDPGKAAVKRWGYGCFSVSTAAINFLLVSSIFQGSEFFNERCHRKRNKRVSERKTGSENKGISGVTVLDDTNSVLRPPWPLTPCQVPPASHGASSSLSSTRDELNETEIAG